MRVIDAFVRTPHMEPDVRAAAFSPDGRFVATTTKWQIAVLDWLGGRLLAGLSSLSDAGGPVFTADGDHVVYCSSGLLYQIDLTENVARQLAGGFDPGYFAQGVAVSPDGKTLVATRAGSQQSVRLKRWELPGWQQLLGFDFWSPFDRLAFSPNGEFLAGINREAFELRFAVSGGLNGRHRFTNGSRPGFLGFSPDSLAVVFGWDAEFWIMETRNGNVVRRVASPTSDGFAGVAFTGSGRQVVTVDRSPVMRLWSTEMWQLIREYDWAAGGLTSVAVSADGLVGVCGTDTGKLVAFDVDE